MIAYAYLGTDDLDRAAAFYDRLFDVLSVPRTLHLPDRLIAWGAMWTAPFFGVARPFDGAPAAVGNGTMIALAVESRSLIDRAYRTALASGGRDEVPPGGRGPDPDGFYGAYFRDLDGHKICLARYGPADR